MFAVNVATVGLLLVKVMVSWLVPPGAITAGEKLLVILGGVVMVSSAEAAAVLLPLSVCNPPATIVLVTAPAVLLVTFAVMVQLP